MPLTLHYDNPDFNCSDSNAYPACNFDRFENPGASFNKEGGGSDVYKLDYQVGTSRNASEKIYATLSARDKSRDSNFSVKLGEDAAQGPGILKYFLTPSCALELIEITSPDGLRQLLLDRESCSTLLSFETEELTSEHEEQFSESGGIAKNVVLNGTPSWIQARMVCQRMAGEFVADDYREVMLQGLEGFERRFIDNLKSGPVLPY